MAVDRNVERRLVQSDDPALSAEANRLLTAELRRIVGRDEVEVPAGTPHRERERRAGHSIYAATLAANRLVILVTFLTMVVVGAVVSLATGSWWALIAALGVHALGTLLVAVGAIQLTTEVEHASPQVAARLEAEGVRDADKLLSELVEEFAGTQETHGTAEVIASGHNERRMDPNVEPVHAAVGQRSAMTPQSEPGPPAPAESRPGIGRGLGEDRRVIARRFMVVIALVVIAVVAFVVLMGVVLGYY